MTAKVGAKGQVVIDKEIRDRLGVRPGWIALQRLVDDHVEISFVPPEHHRSLKGSLAPYMNFRIPGDDALEEAIARAWDAVADEAITD